MALKTRFDYYGLTTGIKTERLYPVSRMVSTITGLTVQRNKAIVGRNAFAHESGIHQDGMLKERSTYEIMRPEEVGVPRTDLVLGKHSGRHALRERVIELGYHLDRRAVRDPVRRLQGPGRQEEGSLRRGPGRPDREAHRGRARALAAGQPAHDGRLERAARRPPSAIRRPDGEVVQDAAIGDGPVDAIFKAVERVTGVAANLREFVVRSVTQGKDAQGEVTLELEVESDDRTFRGRAASTDIIEASAQAYLNAVNAIATRRERGHPREVVGRPGAGA